MEEKEIIYFDRQTSPVVYIWLGNWKALELGLDHRAWPYGASEASVKPIFSRRTFIQKTPPSWTDWAEAESWLLLQSQHLRANITLHVGKLTRHAEEVVNGGDVIHCVSKHSHLLLPLVLKQIHVILGHLAVRLGGQGQGGINHLQFTQNNPLIQKTKNTVVRLSQTFSISTSKIFADYDWD